MKNLIFLLPLIAIVFVSGCTVPGGPGAPITKVCEPGERRCLDENLEQCNGDGSEWAVLDQCQYGCDPASLSCKAPPSTKYSITVLTGPTEATVGDTISIGWRVNSDTTKPIAHTATHYGYTSVPNARVPSDYPNLTTVRSGNIPSVFTGQIKAEKVGTIYYRSHAIIDGNNYWSTEKTITIKAAPVTAYSIAISQAPTTAYVNQPFTVIWNVNAVNPTTIDRTAIYYDTVSHPGTYLGDVAPLSSGYPSFTQKYASGNFSIPNTFNATITLDNVASGKLYFRAYTRIGQVNYWTGEQVLTVNASPGGVKTFTIEADDAGFYPSGTISVSKGEQVQIIFKVRTTNVYYGGLEFESNPITYFDTGKISPGDQKTVSFTADASFSFTSYLPEDYSKVPKKTGQVVVS